MAMNASPHRQMYVRSIKTITLMSLLCMWSINHRIPSGHMAAMPVVSIQRWIYAPGVSWSFLAWITSSKVPRVRQYRMQIGFMDWPRLRGYPLSRSFHKSEIVLFAAINVTNEEYYNYGDYVFNDPGWRCDKRSIPDCPGTARGSALYRLS